jgi:two-component system, cell cycle sensor histidine kinase and response regulator CckA
MSSTRSSARRNASKLYDFTPPYAQIRVPVFAHKKLGGIVDISSLQGFTIGVKAGDAVIETLAAHGIDSLKEYPSYEAIVLAAKQHDLKVFSVDEPAAYYYLYKHELAADFRTAFVLYTGEFHRAVHKGNADLLALVQDGFAKCSPREFQAIDEKWLGSPFLLKEALRKWLPVVLLAAAAILLLAGGNLFLRHKVRLRTAELRESRARLENILRLAPVGICVVHHRVILEANQLFCTILGLDPANVVGQSTRVIYESDEDFDHYGREFYGQIARQGVVSLELHTRRKDGQRLVVLVSGAPLDPARPEEEVIFTALDITERKKAEEALRDSREYFHTMFNAIDDALFIHDAKTGKLLDVNQRMVEMYGYGSREEVLALPEEALFCPTPPHTWADATKWIEKARKLGPQTFEWQSPRRNGQVFWTEVNLRQVQVGSDSRLVVTVRDISDRKAAEEERLNYVRRLQEGQKLESLGLLAGGIAHDFNNLLTAILGNIDLAMLDIPKDSTARADLASAVAATRRAADLAQQMLAYSGKGHFVIEALDVEAEIRSTTQMLQSSISRNADLQIEAPRRLPAIEADASQFRQVLMNLVINASEALEKQPGTIRIRAGTVEGETLDSTQLRPREPLEPGLYVFVEVADTGAGIRPEFLDKIFEPFFSTKFTGRGLGLAAVLGIVRGHKGAMQVESTPGHGTTMRAYFPATEKAPLAEPEPGVPSEAGHIRSGLILLVDDEASLRETACKLLKRLGYQILCAADGEQAIRLFRTRSAQITGVILDLAMPRMDGVETLVELRRIRPDVPVAISSGYAELDVLQRFRDPKPDGFIQKPYTLETLRQALDQIWPA